MGANEQLPMLFVCGYEGPSVIQLGYLANIQQMCYSFRSQELYKIS